MPGPRVIYSASEAIHALGGANFVAELFGIGPNAVRNWYKRGLPPETYSKLAPRLRAAGHEFSDELFRQYPAVFKPKSPLALKPPPEPKPKRRRRKNGGR
jgi:hypothetical protein